jgi:hypothetical protein
MSMTKIADLRGDLTIALEEVAQLHLMRYVWKNMLAMFESRPDLPHNSLVNNYVLVTYTRTLAIGIRRQCQASDSRATIGSVLRRVAAHPSYDTWPVISSQVFIVMPTPSP